MFLGRYIITKCSEHIMVFALVLKGPKYIYWTLEDAFLNEVYGADSKNNEKTFKKNLKIKAC